MGGRGKVGRPTGLDDTRRERSDRRGLARTSTDWHGRGRPSLAKRHLLGRASSEAARGENSARARSWVRRARLAGTIGGRRAGQAKEAGEVIDEKGVHNAGGRGRSGEGAGRGESAGT